MITFSSHGSTRRACSPAGIVCLVLAAASVFGDSKARSEPASWTGAAFVGPLAGWMDARRDFGAVGDGRADDTVALQRALDALRPPQSSRRVLFIPPGDYRITRTLHVTRTSHAESMDIEILGEDPAHTTLRWDGPDGGVMLDYGAWYARLGRITLDGAGRAKTALAHGPNFVTYNELSDLVFRDVDFGIEAGRMDAQGIAETAVLRCHFDRCRKAGISLQNFNSLDWFIRNCTFDDCAIGVTNAFGAGNFHVYDSLFRRSTVADITIGNTGYFSFRNNTSLDSRAFFVAGVIGAGAGLTLQGNNILDPTETPIQVGNLGPVLLLDNTIRSRASPAVRVNPTAGFLSMGNTFTVANAIEAKASAPRVDDRVIDPGVLRVRAPAPVDTPLHERWPVIEVPAGASATVIQKAIDSAEGQTGPTVVHLPAATYAIDRTLVVLGANHVLIVGDGGRTVLRWAGTGGGPVMELPAVPKAVLQDFTIDGAGLDEGLAIEGCDQPGARVLLEEANIRQGKKVGLRVEGIRRARIDLQDMNHSDSAIGVQVLGRGRTMPDEDHVVIWSGASSNNQLSYEVGGGGRLMARDIWYEGAPAGFMHCTDSGVFTLHGAQIAAGDPNHGGAAGVRPTIDVAGFRGRLTFLTAIFAFPWNRLAVESGTAETKVLMIGQGNRDDFLTNDAPAARASLIESVKYTPGGGAMPVPDRGSIDPDFLREMLAQTRSARPHPDAPPPPGVTDVDIQRVTVMNASYCLRITP